MNKLSKYIPIGLIGAAAIFGGCATTKPALIQDTAKTEMPAAAQDSALIKKIPETNYEQKIADLTASLRDTLKNINSRYGSTYLKNPDSASTTRISFGNDSSGLEEISMSFPDRNKGFSYSVNIIGGKKFLNSTTINIKKDGRLVASFLDCYGILEYKKDSTGAKVEVKGEYGLDFSEAMQSDQAAVPGKKYSSSNRPIDAVRKKLNKNYFEILSMALSAAKDVEMRAQGIKVDREAKSVEEQIRSTEALPFDSDEDLNRAIDEINRKALIVKAAGNSYDSLVAVLQIKNDSLDAAIKRLEKEGAVQIEKERMLKELDLNVKAKEDSIINRSAYLNVYESSLEFSKDSLSRANAELDTAQSRLEQNAKYIGEEKAKLESRRSKIAKKDKDIALAEDSLRILDEENRKLEQRLNELNALDKTLKQKRDSVEYRSQFLASYEARLKRTADSLSGVQEQQTRRERDLDSLNMNLLEKSDKLKTRKKQ